MDLQRDLVSSRTATNNASTSNFCYGYLAASDRIFNWLKLGSKCMAYKLTIVTITNLKLNSIAKNELITLKSQIQTDESLGRVVITNHVHAKTGLSN